VIENGQKIKPDTTFLINRHWTSKSEGKEYPEFLIVYIDTNRVSKYYDLIANFDIEGDITKQIFQQGIDILMNANKTPFTKHPTNEIQKKWVPLYIYMDKFYIKTTINGCGTNCGCVQITDSTYLTFGGESPQVSRLNGIKKVDDKTFKINISNYDTVQSVLDITYLNRGKGIALFGKTLMVSADKMRLYSIIVEESSTMTKGELIKFDEPELKRVMKILKQK